MLYISGEINTYNEIVMNLMVKDSFTTLWTLS